MQTPDIRKRYSERANQMDKDDVSGRAISKEQAALGDLSYDGPLGSKIPHLPVDYLLVVRGLDDSSDRLKGNWHKENVRNRRYPYYIPELQYAHTTSRLEESGSCRYSGQPALFVTSGGE